MACVDNGSDYSHRTSYEEEEQKNKFNVSPQLPSAQLSKYQIYFDDIQTVDLYSNDFDGYLDVSKYYWFIIDF